MKKEARTYERKREFWISGKSKSAYGDILLPVGELEIHVTGDRMECSRPEEVEKNGRPLESNEVILGKGDRITFGDYGITFYEKVLEIKGDLTDCAVRLIETQGEAERFEGFPYYKRSPRIIYRIEGEKIEVKAPPEKKSMGKGGILQMIVPTLSTTAFTVFMGIMMKRGPYVYMSVGMTVITLCFSIQNFMAQKKEIREENKKREEVYQKYLLKIRREIREARKKEREAMDYQNPRPPALADMVLHDSTRLYERSLLDDDFLQVNLGYRQGSSRVTVTFAKDDLEPSQDELLEAAREIPKEYAEIQGIPVAVDLKRANLGIVGSRENVHEQLKYLLLQLTFFQSYRDLQIVFLHHEAYREEFSYVRWYPHLRLQSMNVCGEICTDQARDQILGGLQQMLKERRQKLQEEKQETLFSPYFLFIIDEPKLILNHAIMEYLQTDQRNLGFSLIYTTDQQENLPENVRTICILNNAADGKLLLEEGVRKNRGFDVVHMKGIDPEATSRALSAIIHEQGISSKIPESITFFDMYKIEHPQELNIRERWKSHESHKSLAVPLGVRAEEDYVELNLHEKAHGPHGLVAGTTGSGKSETVQSYILSLAVNFHPHEVGFLLIDYKGGGMANLFAKLPHLLGTITNLDKAESMRAMASIKSELSRRQRILGENNVNHINGYNKLYKLGRVKEPLPHLFLISDEFAELKKEQPDFMSELISAARIGRSLGIHLILATQKPSGVVDDQIWTNSKFRLCLKVQNAGDSKEMLKTPDAANITQAGRAYLQVGNNEIYELFQSAWSGAVYGGGQTGEEKEDDRVYLVNELGQGELINRDLSGPAESTQIKATQLDVTVEHLAQVYEAEHAVQVKKPWLPPLGAMLESPYTREVRDSAVFEKGDYTLGLGMIDVPEEQLQEEYVLDLMKNGHLLYMASGGYGKTMLLTHIILGLSMKNSVKNLNFYVIDLGNSALIPLRGLPHVADYMGFDDTEKLEKLPKLILQEISERKRLLAKAMAQNIHVYNESQKEPLKALVIVVDNYDVIGELGDAMTGFLQKIARDGAGLGIYLLVTMTRDSVMRAATKGNFKERLAGFNFVEGENSGFIGRSQIKLPEERKGRALVKRSGINLMQLYAPVPCENELTYNELLKERIRRVAETSTEERAKGIPTLPEKLYYEMLTQYPGYEERTGRIPVGIDVETLEVQYLEVEKEPGLVIGEGGMGRTNTLCNALKHIRRQNAAAEIYLFDSPKGDLSFAAGWEGVHYTSFGGGYEQTFTDLEAAVEERKKAPEEAEPPLYILIDVIQSLYEGLEEKGLAKKLALIEEALSCGVYLVAASDANLRASRSSLFQKLSQVRNGIVVGNVKKQNVFPYTKIREENRDVDMGYHFGSGGVQKIRFVQYL